MTLLNYADISNLSEQYISQPFILPVSAYISGHWLPVGEFCLPELIAISRFCNEHIIYAHLKLLVSIARK